MRADLANCPRAIERPVGPTRDRQPTPSLDTLEIHSTVPNHHHQPKELALNLPSDTWQACGQQARDSVASMTVMLHRMRRSKNQNEQNDRKLQQRERLTTHCW